MSFGDEAAPPRYIAKWWLKATFEAVLAWALRQIPVQQKKICKKLAVCFAPGVECRAAGTHGLAAKQAFFNRLRPRRRTACFSRGRRVFNTAGGTNCPEKPPGSGASNLQTRARQPNFARPYFPDLVLWRIEAIHRGGSRTEWAISDVEIAPRCRPSPDLGLRLQHAKW